MVVNPNNPTGLSLTPERLLDWHARLAQRGGWLVVDEAFMDNTPQLSLAAQADQVGLIVLRSFGKFFGLAGVRLGFVLAERKLLKLLAEQVGPGPSAGRPGCWARCACATVKAMGGNGCAARRRACAWRNCSNATT